MNTMLRPSGLTGPVRLGRTRKRVVYGVCLGVWASGVLWLVFHYFLRRSGDFGPETHPLEPWCLRLHGAFAFAALWTLGLLSASHIASGWSTGRRRWSGALLLTLGGVLVVTGYLLYYAVAENLRQATSYVHWGLGLGAPLAFLFHRLRARARSRAAHRAHGAQESATADQTWRARARPEIPDPQAHTVGR